MRAQDVLGYWQRRYFPLDEAQQASFLNRPAALALTAYSDDVVKNAIDHHQRLDEALAAAAKFAELLASRASTKRATPDERKPADDRTATTSNKQKALPGKQKYAPRGSEARPAIRRSTPLRSRDASMLSRPIDTDLARKIGPVSKYDDVF